VSSTSTNKAIAKNLLVFKNAFHRILLLIKKFSDSFEAMKVDKFHFVEQEAHLVTVIF
jgi:hypothetical protein